jgi:hypothetical protein
MKNLTHLFMRVLVAIFMLTISTKPAVAQEKEDAKAAPTEGGRKMSQTTVTRLLDNERVEVVRMVSTPGDKGAMKERPDRLLYIIQGAKVRFHYPDGKTEDALWKTEDVVYQKADNRQVENIDTRDLEYISVHLK